MIPEPLDYGFFRAIQLVIPPLRDRKVEWLLKEYTAIKDRLGTSSPSIIAHSLGSYLVARLLEKYEQVKFDRIILCGSIIRKNFPWTAIFDRKQVTRVLNDYGGRDFWAKAAEWVVNDSGPSGAKGFDDTAGGRVVVRFHPDFRHSDFFYSLNYEQSWIPFLKGSDPSTNVPLPDRSINWKFWTIVVSALVALLLASWIVLRPHSDPKWTGNDSKVLHRVGHADRNEWTVGAADPEGMMQFGPYVSLKDGAGTYEAYWILKLDAACPPSESAKQVMPVVDFDVYDTTQQTIVQSLPVDATTWGGRVHEYKKFLIEFDRETKELKDTYEFRTRWHSGCGVTLKELGVTKKKKK